MYNLDNEKFKYITLMALTSSHLTSFKREITEARNRLS